MANHAYGNTGWAPLPSRIALGIIFFAHGAQKLLGLFGGSGWSKTMQMFSQYLHIPAPLAAFVILLEFVGGVLLVAGLLTRWVALLIAIEMVVAAVMVHLPNGFFVSGPGQKAPGIEYNLALVGALLALAILGGGRLSVDAAMSRDKAA